MHLQLLSVRTNPSFTGLNIPLLLPLNDSPRKSPGGLSFPPRRPEYTVGRHNGSVLQLHYSHSFFVQHVRCLFSIHQLQGNQTRFVIFAQVQTAQWLFGSPRSCFISNVERSKGDPSSSHFPPFERQTFYGGGALSSRPPALKLELLFWSLNFAITAAHALSIFR